MNWSWWAGLPAGRGSLVVYFSPTWWFSKGIPLISGKSRLVKYYKMCFPEKIIIINDTPNSKRLHLPRSFEDPFSRVFSFGCQKKYMTSAWGGGRFVVIF